MSRALLSLTVSALQDQRHQRMPGRYFHYPPGM